MAGFLSLEKDMFLQMDVKRKNENNIFKCDDVIQFENALNYQSTRYMLSNEKDSYILDVQKDSMKNITLTCYHLIEAMEFDLNFLSLVGTSPLGYNNPKMPNVDYVLYEKEPEKHEECETIKFMVTEEELPSNDPEDMGYYQDGNGHWYFMTQRTKGSLLKFENDYKLSWEYKQEKDERLLIEMQAFKNMQEYIREEPTIYIYEGKALKRKDIKIVTSPKVLELT